MAQVITYGPLGTLVGLANVDAEVFGVRARRFPSGRESSNEIGHGKTSLSVFYVDGRRSSRRNALERLRQKIGEGERVEICGPTQTKPFKLNLSA